MHVRTLLTMLMAVTAGSVAQVAFNFEDVLIPLDLIRLYNHRWSSSCQSRLDHRTRVPYGKKPDAVGPCVANLNVIPFPENFSQRKILIAECDPACAGKSCYGTVEGSTFYKCGNEVREVAVIDPWGEIKSFKISVGCLCGKVPSTDGNPFRTV